MTRECGDCSLCCKLPMIADLNKPADAWCQHCKPGQGGCTIYSDRPEVCSRFKCEWLKGVIEDIWQPTKAKMLCHLSDGGDGYTFFNILVDLGSPKRWREKRYYERIRQMAAVGRLHKVIVRIHVGARAWIILPNGVELEVPDNVIGFDVIPRPGTWELKWNYADV